LRRPPAQASGSFCPYAVFVNREIKNLIDSCIVGEEFVGFIFASNDRAAMLLSSADVKRHGYQIKRPPYRQFKEVVLCC
jgi:hypothetical protein